MELLLFPDTGVISIWDSEIIIMIINYCDASYVNVVPHSLGRWLQGRSSVISPDVPWCDERKTETRLRLSASFLPSKLIGQFRQSCSCLSSALLILNHVLYSTNSTQAQWPQKYPNKGGAACCNQHIWFIIHFHVCITKTDKSQRRLRDSVMMRCGGKQMKRYGGKHNVWIHT